MEIMINRIKATPSNRNVFVKIVELLVPAPNDCIY